MKNIITTFGITFVSFLTGALVLAVINGEINSGAANPMQLDALAVVPEPSPLALAAIGVASLLMFRRKK